MKKLILAIITLVMIFAFTAKAVTLLRVPQGGTGVGTITTGSYLKGAGTGALVERSASEVKTDLSLNLVENTALSTWAGTGNITTLGTIGTGIWNGTTIADGYISSAGSWNTAYGWGDHSIVGYLTGNETITLSGDTSGSGTTAITTTIGADKVHDTMIDWGTGANQISSTDMPDHNGHSVRDTFVHIVNRGVAEAITVTLTGGLGVSWTTGEIYDRANHTFVATDAGSGNVTNNVVNYLKWVSGTTLTLSTSDATGDEVLIAIGSVYDGNIDGYREMSLLDESLANIRRCARAVFPTRVTSGMSVHEDTDATNPLDVTMDAGVYCKELQERITPVEIKSRNTAMVRHFHTAGVWDSDTNAQIETTNYDNGTGKTAIPSNKWVKGLFVYMNGKIGFVYPTECFNTTAEAQEGALPAMPTGLEPIPKLTAVVYQQGAANFTNAIWQDVRAGIGEQVFGGVSDHGALAGLSDDDHTQYALLAGRGAGQTLIGGTTTTSDLTLQTTSGVGTTGADMHFKVGNNGATEAMTILNNGNVGIGTVTPRGQLDVAGIANTDGIHFTGVAGRNDAVLTIETTGAAGGSSNVDQGLVVNIIGNGVNANILNLKNNSTSRLIVKETGLVGIGTTTPDTPLHIYDASATSDFYIESGGAGLGGRIIMEDSDGAGCSSLTTLNGVLTAAIIACP